MAASRAAPTRAAGPNVGDSGGRGAPAVDAADLARTRANVGNASAAARLTHDHNHDGAINAADVLLVRNNQRRSLPPFTAPFPAAPATAATAVSPSASRAAPVRRGLLGEPPAEVPL